MMLPFILSCLKPLGLNAQSFTTQGTDFWAALMPNWLDKDVDNYYLSACGPRSCSVTISNPNTGWTHTISIPAMRHHHPISFPTLNVGTNQVGHHQQQGLHIASTDTIQAMGISTKTAPSTCDATQIVPTHRSATNTSCRQHP